MRAHASTSTTSSADSAPAPHRLHLFVISLILGRLLQQVADVNVRRGYRAGRRDGYQRGRADGELVLLEQLGDVDPPA